jgi:hypothetical protein
VLNLVVVERRCALMSDRLNASSGNFCTSLMHDDSLNSYISKIVPHLEKIWTKMEYTVAVCYSNANDEINTGTQV